MVVQANYFPSESNLAKEPDVAVDATKQNKTKRAKSWENEFA